MQPVTAGQAPAEIVYSDTKPPLIEKIIRQKVASYAQYNQISNQLFVRNMQVYFSLLSWPTDKNEAEAFKSGFIDTPVGYAIEMYKGTVARAAQHGKQVIEEAHVAQWVADFTPFEVME